MTCEHCGYDMLGRRRVHFAKATDVKPCPGSWSSSDKLVKKKEE